MDFLGFFFQDATDYCNYYYFKIGGKKTSTTIIQLKLVDIGKSEIDEIYRKKSTLLVNFDDTNKIYNSFHNFHLNLC